jgi:phospho-N-acetylmuramoyl-pentapeptide-transferase
MLLDLVKIFVPTAVAFFLGLFLTPLATNFFFKYKMWKRYSRNGEIKVAEFQKIHNEKEELNTPRIGGIIIWISVLLTTIVFYLFSIIFPGDTSEKMNFLSRNQTLVPLFTLLMGAFIGLWDDLIQIYGSGRFAHDDKSWRKWKALMVGVVALIIGMWFYYKLGLTSIHIPFDGELYLGALVVPFFVIVALAIFSGGVIDGIDGLSGGVLASIFASYAAIAYANHQVDIAAFSGVITGAILAFLWFNIPPARFYMGETGMMGLTMSLATIAFLTDSVLILPLVAILLVVTSLSVILQVYSKKLRGGKRIFKLSPLHHHFEAIGWSRDKIVMRYWVLSVIFAIIGVVLAIISR